MVSVKFYLRLTGMVFLLGILVCRQDSGSSGDAILDIRLPKEPEKLNPVFFPNSISREVCQYILLPLADYDPVSLELVPLLIKAVPEGEAIDTGKYKGGIKYTFEILEDARWDDGKPVTGEDYLFTLKAAMHPGTTASAFRNIISKFSAVTVDPENPRKVSVTFAKYFIVSKEAALNVEVLPKHIYDAGGVMDRFTLADFMNEEAAEALASSDSSLVRFATEINGLKFTKQTVVGCGPYRLATWQAGQHIVLEKKENYWARDKKMVSVQQHADKIILHFIPDETAAYTRLKNNELDVLSGLSVSNFEQLQKDSSDLFNFQSPQLMKYYNVIVNHGDAILSSVAVRQAIAHVVNADEYIRTFEMGKATRTVGPINPAKPYYNHSIKPYAFDVEAAKKGLEADGWTDADGNGIREKKIGKTKMELRIPIIYSGDLGKNICLMMQADARKAGIELELQFKEFALVRKENLETGNFSLVLQSSVQDIGYEDLSLRFHSENAELGEGNYGLFKNPAIDALIDEINATRDAQKRADMFKQVQVLFHEQLPYIFLYSPKERIVISKRWQGTTNAKRPGYQANTFIPQANNS
ncbi:MAG: hypothetical protein IPN29_21375 [Saprospiraceae bacterium]|nr:hypothetical protein [Saprospiraceae bacterium]